MFESLEQVDTLTPSRATDAFVAETVCGWKWYREDMQELLRPPYKFTYAAIRYLPPNDKETAYFDTLPHFTDDDATFLKLIQHVNTDYPQLELHLHRNSHGNWYVTWYGDFMSDHFNGHSPTLALAGVKATLKVYLFSPRNEIVK